MEEEEKRAETPTETLDLPGPEDEDHDFNIAGTEPDTQREKEETAVEGAIGADPSSTDFERERARNWLSYPREARAAVRRLHHMIGHKPKEAVIQILKGARAAPTLIEAATYFKCEACSEINKDKPPRPAKAPSRYEFNREICVDVFEVEDDNDQRHSVFSIVCAGACFHQAAIVRVGGGTPYSKKCLQKLNSRWVSWAGWPRILTSDRGVHNKGVFSRALTQNGVFWRQAGLEAPEQIGRAERHGGILKEVIKRLVVYHHVIGKQAMKLCLSVCLEIKNQQVRRGGIAPAQWVLGRCPRNPARLLDDDEAGQLGAIEDRIDATTSFGRTAALRLSAMKEFVRIGCGRRFAKTQLRMSRPIPGPYRLGDLACFYHKDRWSGVSRIIGVGDQVVWVLYEGLPVCTATHKIRPANFTELMTFRARNPTSAPFGTTDGLAGAGDQQMRFQDLRSDARFDAEMLENLDYWEKAGRYWIRHHVTPRLEKFMPSRGDQDDGGPNIDTLMPERCTHNDGRDEPILDEWPNGDQSISSASAHPERWTGRTVFEEALKRGIEMAAIAPTVTESPHTTATDRPQLDETERPKKVQRQEDVGMVDSSGGSGEPKNTGVDDPLHPTADDALERAWLESNPEGTRQPRGTAQTSYP